MNDQPTNPHLGNVGKMTDEAVEPAKRRLPKIELELNPRLFVLLGTVVVLAVVYVGFFTDFFNPRPIVVTTLPMNSEPGSPRMPFPIMQFVSAESWEFDEVRLVRIDESGEEETYWHLVGDPASEPTDLFAYGGVLQGMRKADEEARRRRLAFGETYRLEMSAGRHQGEIVFDTPPPRDG